MVKSENAWHAGAPVLCGRSYCGQLARRLAAAGAPPPHSVVAEKWAQRVRVLDAVAACRTAASARGVGVQPVNVYLFDDLLPGDATLSQQLVDRFGAAAVRVFSPNLKPAVVSHLVSLSGSVDAGHEWLVAGCGCYCAYNARFGDDIRRAGGLDRVPAAAGARRGPAADVVFADCFGSLRNGSGPLVDDLVARRLFRPQAGRGPLRPPVWLGVAVSDLTERFDPGVDNVWQATLHLVVDLPRRIADRPDAPYVLHVTQHRAYGRTMHFVEGALRDREWVPPDCTAVVSVDAPAPKRPQASLFLRNMWLSRNTIHSLLQR